LGRHLGLELQKSIAAEAASYNEAETHRLPSKPAPPNASPSQEEASGSMLWADDAEEHRG
jgi:hypothetical protein